MALKINPQKYNWPQKTCKLLKNKFPGSNWRVILMRIKVLVTEICVFLTKHGTVTDFWFFWRVKKIISRKKSHHVSRLSLGYLWEEYKKFWFFIMCQIFSIWLGLSGHSLLKLFFNLNYMLKRANGLKTISNWLVLLSRCFRSLKPFRVNKNRSWAPQTHTRDIINILLTSFSRSEL